LHEFSLMQEVVAAILAELQKSGEKVGPGLEVRLTLGALEMHSEGATRQAYEVLVKGTPLEGSRLTLIIEPASLSCPKCGYAGALPDEQVDPHDLAPLAECPSCRSVTPVQGGRGVGAIRLVFADQPRQT
jgi:Zn finger protein HypA/HybF involved in hydrogenase expression